MTLTDGVLLLFIIALLSGLLFEQVMTGWLKGETLLKVALLRTKALDGSLFIVLVAILLVNNMLNQGTALTSGLLSLLLLCSLYLVWFRRPLLLFKTEGFWLGALFIPYSRIRQLDLSQDGVLVVGLERRQLMIRVRSIEDLEQIYQTLVATRA